MTALAITLYVLGVAMAGALTEADGTQFKQPWGKAVFMLLWPLMVVGMFVSGSVQRGGKS